MLEKYIWIIGSTIFAILGFAHLFFTFFSNKFLSKNENMILEMKSSTPILTKETTMWKAWIGFNASHSSGAMFIGIINIYLVYNFWPALKVDLFFFIFNILTIGFYLWLAKKYWFKVPFFGILITLICYITTFIITR
tara:strand:+ start:148295 stop:148705 length:411 start_codon:yes stop_codon:yes gene_type:complete